jgi:hypothetical protein
MYTIKKEEDKNKFNKKTAKNWTKEKGKKR